MDGGGEGTVFGWWIDQMVDVVHGEVSLTLVLLLSHHQHAVHTHEDVILFL